jgi:type I restriction enzyme S subunit
MAGPWIEVPFPEVIDFQEGAGILAKDFPDEGVPLIRLSGLECGSSILPGCNYLDPEMVARKWAHFALATGDVLLSTSASLGRVDIDVVGEDAVGATPHTGIIRMRLRDGRLIAPFLRYLLEVPHFQQQAEMVGLGSVIRHFGPMHLR